MKSFGYLLPVGVCNHVRPLDVINRRHSRIPGSYGTGRVVKSTEHKSRHQALCFISIDGCFKSVGIRNRSASHIQKYVPALNLHVRKHLLLKSPKKSVELVQRPQQSNIGTQIRKTTRHIYSRVHVYEQTTVMCKD